MTVAAAVLLPASIPANAVSGNIPFNGNIPGPNLCSIVVSQDGVLAQNLAETVLSSKEVGGVAGTARVYSFEDYWLSVQAPVYFTSAPPTGNDNVTFQALFSGTSFHQGATFAERPGDSPVQLQSGFTVTDVTVNLIATRTVSTFPHGFYSAWTVLRCE